MQVKNDLQKQHTEPIKISVVHTYSPPNTSQTLLPSTNESLKASIALNNIQKNIHRPASLPLQPESHELITTTSLPPRWKLWVNAQLAPDSTPRNSSLLKNSLPADYDFKNFSPEKKLIVFDPRLKKTGVVTGTIRIVTLEKDRLEDDLRLNRAHITENFPQINTYFITSTDSVFDLDALYKNLKAKSYISECEIEILSRIHEKN